MKSIRKVAILGAGVMGAQIAAHMANAGLETLLYELPANEGPDKSAAARKALAGLKKLKPPPLAHAAALKHIEAANYEEHLPALAGCDLVIEAIAEKMEWKLDLFNKITPHLGEGTWLASNTSGLSIQKMADALPEALQARFCGVHFFNPPRYMHLVELIPTENTDPAMLDALETFLTTRMGKGIVRAKDTPNFIGNRIGVFSILATMHHTAAFGLSFDEVDALTGTRIGRPKSATYRTADVVGLDTMAHVIQTMSATLPDDPWHDYFQVPAWLQQLIDAGALGQKTRCGIYRKQGKTIEVLDVEKGDYRPSGKGVADEVKTMLKLATPAEQMAALRASDHPQAQFLWACFRDLFHYCACQLEGIADTARDLDFAIRWGYGWKLGPFELWQAAGWKTVAGWIAEEIEAGKTMAATPLPDWVNTLEHGPHAPEGSYSPARQQFVGRSKLPVYRRQPYPDPLISERYTYGETVFENDAVRLWHEGDGAAVLSFKTKMHTISREVLDSIHQAVDVAEQDFKTLILWQTEEPFSAGADLSGALAALQAGEIEAFTDMVDRFQQTSQRLRYSSIPVVSAPRGLALGGGCEFTMHCDRVVAALETYIGLVEVGVGLLPAGGGLKEIARRLSALPENVDPFPFLQRWFETVAMGKVAGSALEAIDMGFLGTCSKVVFHPHEVLHVARQQGLFLAEAGYTPPLPDRQIRVAGKTGIANLKLVLVNMLEGHFISEHDYEIGSRIAEVICGGEVEAGERVDETWLLDLERKHFVELAQMPKTQERIAHMLKTGKPLRN